MMKTPYKPREVSKIDADIFRELIFSKRLLPTGTKNPSKKIRFFEADSPSVIEKNFLFALKIGQQRVDLTLELKPESALANRLREVGGLESLPEEFQVALMTYASREIINALEHLFQLPVTLWNAAKDQEELCEKKELYFEVLNEHAACEARAGIAMSMPLLERVLDAAKKIPMVKNQSVTGSILHGEVLLGSATVLLEDWERLRPGDLIVIQEPSALTTGQGKCLIPKSGIMPMIVKPDFFKPLVLSLETVFPTGLKTIPPVTEQYDLPEKGAVPSIPLELNFSGGVISLAIEEVIQLNKTKTIEKPVQVLRPLKIFIHEQVVGTGELVNINGHYALVVTQLYSQH